MNNIALVNIWDKVLGQVVEAEIVANFSASEVALVHQLWSAHKALAKAYNPQANDVTANWDWVTIWAAYNAPTDLCFGIKYDGNIQGLALLQTRGFLSLYDGNPIPYLAFLETAPWNRDVGFGSSDSSGYSLIGTRLVEQVHYESQKAGFKGRLALHSLPDAEPFYQKLGFTRSLNFRPGMTYFEY